MKISGHEFGRINILGVGVDAVNLECAVKRVEDWISQGKASYAIFRDVHGIMLCQQDQRLKRIHHEAGLVAPDGMPLVWLARSQAGTGVGRVYGPDFMLNFCQTTAKKGYRHYFYGASPTTVELLVRRLQNIAPDLQIAGAMSPPFRDLAEWEDAAIVETINAARPDIVWVGLSTPKQEYWMANNIGRLTAKALMGVGAAFDFNSGQKSQAPLWLRQSGFEWLFRMATEPRRLGKRYMRHVPRFIILATAQAIGWKHFDIG